MWTQYVIEKNMQIWMPKKNAKLDTKEDTKLDIKKGAKLDTKVQKKV